MRIAWRALGSVIVLTLAAIMACKRSASSVEGRVTFNGEPVSRGSIAFVPANSGGQPFGESIVNGVYKVDSQRVPAPGTYKVQIRWPKPSGRKMKTEDGSLQDELAESLPKKFHDETSLTAEIKPGANMVNFALQP